MPDAWRVGVRREWPTALVQRLACLHFVDSVVGQTLPFAPEEVAGSRIGSEVVALDGPRVRLRLAGATRAAADGTWRLGRNDWTPSAPWPRGVRLDVLGHATWHGEQGRFEDFVLVGLGERWSATEFNGREGDPGPAGLGVVLALDDSAAPGRIAPAFIDIYAAPWVRPGRLP